MIVVITGGENGASGCIRDREGFLNLKESRGVSLRIFKNDPALDSGIVNIHRSRHEIRVRAPEGFRIGAAGELKDIVNHQPTSGWSGDIGLSGFGDGQSSLAALPLSCRRAGKR